MEKNIGEKLLAQIQELKRDFAVTENKVGVYSLTTNEFNVQIVAVPGEEIGIDLELIDSDRPLLNYGIDNDLYDLKDPNSYDANVSVEDEIIDVMNALKEKKIVIGQRKNRKAFVLPLRDEVKLVYQGRFVVSSKSYKDYQELLSNSGFSPAEQA